MKRRFSGGAVVISSVVVIFIIRFVFLERPSEHLKLLHAFSQHQGLAIGAPEDSLELKNQDGSLNNSSSDSWDESHAPSPSEPLVEEGDRSHRNTTISAETFDSELDDTLNLTRVSDDADVLSPTSSDVLALMLANYPSISLFNSVSVWKYFRPVLDRSDLSINVKEALGNGFDVWKNLTDFVMSEQQLQAAKNATTKNHVEQCSYSITLTNATQLSSEKQMQISCGLIVESSITIIGTPRGSSGAFRVDLLGAKLPSESNPPIILHYNVRLTGDKTTPQPVLVQNTWTAATDWGNEERCPSEGNFQPDSVDGLHKCGEKVGTVNSRNRSAGSGSSFPAAGELRTPWFPFVQGMPFAATLWVGWEGFHLTVNGKHISSFRYHENLEPWLVNSVTWDGDLELSSIIATGLPSAESLVGVAGIESLKAPPLASHLSLFIGVFSTSNNFDRRMALRRTWMQYEAVRSGKVAVRFFVGLHKQLEVNKELWDESLMFGDIQLLPFVDYYNLITLKTLAICLFAINQVNVDYVMKTDDDTFVRVDAVLSGLLKTNKSEGLLYGAIEFDSAPGRDINGKWYISPEEWADASYPPWAHGPGYVITREIADFVVRNCGSRQLKLFKLEDVAMGMWIAEYKKLNLTVHFTNDEHFISGGCQTGYVIAHYQNARQIWCLWQHLIISQKLMCCNSLGA